jgi:signal transduction histidine kinase
VSHSEKYAQEHGAASAVLCKTWFSSLVCRLNQPMRLTQAELEAQFDWAAHEANNTYETHKTYRVHFHPQELDEVMTPRELETLRQMACLREFAGLREVATPREIAGLREVAAMRNPQILRGLDLRGWLAAPLASRAEDYERNLGLIQISEKYDGEFTEEDEAALAELAQMVSIAVENRLRWRQEHNLREAAENAAFAKDEFMAMTSYKLRAQLNTLLGWSWVLRRQAENMEDVTRAAEIIERAARTQARLVEDLLGASRKNAVKWGEEETEGQRDGGIEGHWEREIEEWREEETLKFSFSPSLRPSVSPSLRPSVYYSPNNPSRGMAARGGC